MCLMVDKNVSKPFVKGKLIAFKVFRNTDQEQLMPLYYHDVSDVVEITRDGYYISNRASKNKSRSDCFTGNRWGYWGTYKRFIGKGIHVYLNKKDAIDKMNNDGHYCIVVPVECDEKDLIAFGRQDFDEQAAFMKVKILHKKYRKMCITK